MSYGLPEQTRRRGGIGKLIFPLIIGFAVFMIFRLMLATPQPPTGDQNGAGQGGIFVPDADQHDKYKIKEGLFEPEGQWSIKDVETSGSSNQDTPKSNKTSKGQWSIEEVDGSNAGAQDNPRFKFSR